MAYRIPRRNFFYGAWVRGGGVYPDYQVRLFRRGTAQYNDVAVHENLIVDGEIGTLVGHLDHYTERRIQDHFKKFGLYTTLAAQEKAKTIRTVGWTDLVFRPLVVWVKTYVLKQGFRDGVRGLIVCVFASMYTFVKYAKLWDATRQTASHPDATVVGTRILYVHGIEAIGGAERDLIALLKHIRSSYLGAAWRLSRNWSPSREQLHAMQFPLYRAQPSALEKTPHCVSASRRRPASGHARQSTRPAMIHVNDHLVGAPYGPSA